MKRNLNVRTPHHPAAPPPAAKPTPTTIVHHRLTLDDFLDTDFEGELRRDAAAGLSRRRKCIPCKYLYDVRGSRLFDEICCLPEYYPTRTELAILDRFAPHIMAFFADRGGDLVEIGSGSDLKIRKLLDGITPERLARVRYVPMDISRDCLLEAATRLSGDYTDLRIHGLIADFTRHLDRLPRRRKLITFFGSTIGNFPAREGTALLSRFARIMGPEDRLLIGMDMLKPIPVIQAAYNDRAGVTAAFNLNILCNINRRLQGDFRLDHFEHLAFFNAGEGQMEMHLKARQDTGAYLEAIDMPVALKAGDTIHTEISRKFSRQGAEASFRKAGLVPVTWYADPKEWFSLVALAKAPAGDRRPTS